MVELDSFSSFRDYVQIFTCKAHVFHTDPKTIRSIKDVRVRKIFGIFDPLPPCPWIADSAGAVNVSLLYDLPRGLYRIISMEGTKVTVAALFWR